MPEPSSPSHCRVPRPVALAGMLCLVLAACQAPNSPGAYRDAVVRQDDPFARYVAYGVTHARALRALEPSGIQLAPLVSDPAEIPADLAELEQAVVSGRAEFMLRLEDLVEGSASDLIGCRVDAPSPGEDLTWTTIRVVEREGGAELAVREIETPRSTPSQNWALAYLAAHVGPDRLAVVDPGDVLVAKFTELVASYARADDPGQAATLLSMLRDIETELYAREGLDAARVAEHDARYDAMLRTAGGITYLNLLGSTMELRLRNGNWSVSGLLETWFHELGHALIFERMTVPQQLDFLVLRGLEERTINENACEVVAAVALAHVQRERIRTDGIDGWFDARLIQTVPELTREQYGKLDALYAEPRLIQLGAMRLDGNVAHGELHKEYHSIERKLRVVADHYGLGAFLELAARMDSYAEVDRAVEASEDGVPLPELLDELS